MTQEHCDCTDCMPADEFKRRCEDWARMQNMPEAWIACAKWCQPEPTLKHPIPFTLEGGGRGPLPVETTLRSMELYTARHEYGYPPVIPTCTELDKPKRVGSKDMCFRCGGGCTGGPPNCVCPDDEKFFLDLSRKLGEEIKVPADYDFPVMRGLAPNQTHVYCEKCSELLTERHDCKPRGGFEFL